MNIDDIGANLTSNNVQISRDLPRPSPPQPFQPQPFQPQPSPPQPFQPQPSPRPSPLEPSPRPSPLEPSPRPSPLEPSLSRSLSITSTKSIPSEGDRLVEEHTFSFYEYRYQIAITIGVIAMIVLLLFLVYWFFIRKQTPEEEDDECVIKMEWQNALPKQLYTTLVSKFKSKPSHFCGKPGGIAIWTRNQLKTSDPAIRLFDRWELRDEQIRHCCPKPHFDYLTGYIRVKIVSGPELVRVLSISKSIQYDQLSETLAIRCNSVAAVIAMLLIVTNVMGGHLDYKELKELEKVKETLIEDAKGKNMEKYQKITDELLRNGKQLEFYPPPPFQNPKCEDIECGSRDLKKGANLLATVTLEKRKVK